MRDLAADGDLGEVLHELLSHPLLDAYDEIVGLAAGEVLGDVNHLDARLAELMAQVPGLIEIAAGEARHVVYEDVPPRPTGGLRVRAHPLERAASIDGRA